MINCPECGDLLQYSTSKCDCGWISKPTKTINYFNVREMLKAQAEYYGRKLSEDALNIYEDDLGEFTYHDIKKALDEFRNCGAERMPLAIHIKNKIREKQPKPRKILEGEADISACDVMTEMFYRFKSGVDFNELLNNYSSALLKNKITKARLLAYFECREKILKITGSLIPWNNFKYENKSLIASPEIIDDEKAKMIMDYFNQRQVH